MSCPWKGIAACVLLGLLSSCASTRKISKVGLRTPASISENQSFEAIDIARTRLATAVVDSEKCEGLAKELRFLVSQRVITRECPEQLPAQVQALSSSSVFQGEERSFLESLVNANCRKLTLGGSNLEAQLRNFVDSYDQSGAFNHYRSPASLSDGGLTQSLRALRNSLQSVIFDNLRLESWIKTNGDFVIPISSISVFEGILQSKTCTLSDEQYDPVSKYTETLETLMKLLPEGEQKRSVASLVEKLQALIYEKIPGFFTQRGKS